MTRDKKDTITVYSAVVMLVFGVAITTIAFFIHPIGEIHDSVLYVLGQCLIYSGGALGIANYARSVARDEVNERWNDYRKLADKETKHEDTEEADEGL